MESYVNIFKIFISEELTETNGEVSVLMAAAEVARTCYEVYQDSKYIE